MGLTPDQIGTFGVALVIIIGAIGTYLRSLREKPRGLDPVLAGVGLGFGDKEQTERLIALHERIATALEILADKRTDEMADMHRALLERLDAQKRREEQEEQRPRPVRRRKV